MNDIISRLYKLNPPSHDQALEEADFARAAIERWAEQDLTAPFSEVEAAHREVDGWLASQRIPLPPDPRIQDECPGSGGCPEPDPPVEKQRPKLPQPPPKDPPPPPPNPPNDRPRHPDLSYFLALFTTLFILVCLISCGNPIDALIHNAPCGSPSVGDPCPTPSTLEAAQVILGAVNCPEGFIHAFKYPSDGVRATCEGGDADEGEFGIIWRFPVGMWTAADEPWSFMSGDGSHVTCEGGEVRSVRPLVRFTHGRYDYITDGAHECLDDGTCWLMDLCIGGVEE